ncbi:MAG: hypothetical protein WC460_06565 [Patescibacteria group bacterium]
MLTPEDIKNLTEYQKEIFVTKEDFKRLEGKFDDLLASVDNYAKKANDYYQEMVMMNQKLNRHEKWILQIADKLNIKLEY